MRLKNKEISKSNKESIKWTVWKIHHNIPDLDSYFFNIKNDLEKKLEKFSYDSLEVRDLKLVLLFVKDLLRNLSIKDFNESLLKVKLNILNNFMYNPSDTDRHIIKFFVASNDKINSNYVYDFVKIIFLIKIDFNRIRKLCKQTKIIFQWIGFKIAKPNKQKFGW